MIISLIKSKYLLKPFHKELMFMSWGFLVLLLWNSEPPYIQIIYQNFISGNLWICKLIHISLANDYIN